MNALSFRRLATVAGLALVLSSPALAQTPAKEPTAAQMTAARDVVIASGIGRSIGPIIPQLLDQTYLTVTRTRPELVADMKIVMESIKDEFYKDTTQMVEIAARSFASRLSEQELKDTATFFNTPSGKKYVETQPAAVDDLVNAMQAWQGKMAEAIYARVRAEMKKKGHDL